MSSLSLDDRAVASSTGHLRVTLVIRSGCVLSVAHVCMHVCMAYCCADFFKMLLLSLTTVCCHPHVRTHARTFSSVQVAAGKRANKSVRGALRQLGLPDPILDFTVFPKFFP